jgi:D-beta-D-heptose 7-phosphate kinase/D-beta-D-heptose 1-phosphate adenosyltransferase
MSGQDSFIVGRQRLLEILEWCRDREIWIVGDLMLDEYVRGSVDRISPEAPVPVVKVGDVHNRLGGAANVARQVAALGANAVLAGVVGDDEAGRWLLEECQRQGIDTRGVYVDNCRRTTRKLRVLGHSQQLVRLDWEDAGPCSDVVSAALHDRLAKGRMADAIILSDYAKGVLSDGSLSRLIGFAHTSGRRVIVDPKRYDLGAYRGASILTPNLNELARAAGRRLDPDDRDAIVAVALPIIQAAALEALVVTLSDRGMLLVQRDGESQHVPAVRRAVSDVTGAGDTAVAVLATALAAGSTLLQGMEIANTAAGLAVAEVGAVAVAPHQISSALSEAPRGKVVTREELAARAAGWRMAGKRVVFTNGCFDLLHAGHLSLLHQAAELGDVLVLAINSDASVRRLKGDSRPIVPAEDRAALLAALSCVDAVTIFEEDTPLETLRAARPHVLVKGQDYGIENVVGRDLVETDGGRVVLVPLMDAKSTTAIVERIRVGEAAVG